MEKKIIEKEIEVLHALKIENENHLTKGEKQDLNFLIQLSFDSTGDYIKNESLQGKPSWFELDPGLENELNNKLRQVYIHDTIECYLILINYFDLKINAAIPKDLTINDLFNTGKFYSQNSNIDSLKKKNREIFKKIVSGSIKSNNRSCIVLSFSNYNGIYDSKKLQTQTLYSNAIFNGAPNSSSVYLQNVYDAVSNKLSNNADHKFRCGNNVGIAETVVKAVESAAKVGKLGNAILRTYTTDSLKSLLKLLSSNNDYYSLTIPERLHILSVFVQETMGGYFNGSLGAEDYANKVIRYVPNSDIVTFLHGLEHESVLNSDLNYSGDKTDKDALIYRLVNRIDDHTLGSDNFKLLNQSITNLVLSSKETIDTFSTVTPNNISNRMIYWDEHYTFQVEPVGLNKYDVELTAAGEVKYKRKIVSGYNVANNVVVPIWDETYPEVTLHPFDIVVFVNKSNASMIAEGGAAPGQLNFLPALFLNYASQKAFNQSAMKAVAVTVDIATLVTGPGLIMKAARAGRIAIALFETANTIGMGTDLLLNIIPADPKLKTLVDNFNGIVGIWGLARLGTGVLKLGAALDATIDEAKQISAISKQNAKDFLTAYEDAKTEFAATGNGLTETQKSSINKMKEFLEEEVGKVQAANAINSIEDFWNKIPLDRLEGIKQAFIDGSATLKQATEDFYLYRHCTSESPQLSNWFADEILAPLEARSKLALPNSNTATRIVKVKVPKGTYYIEGGVASQVGSFNFGSYAVGGGKQYYFLSETKSTLIVLDDIPNPK